jgi:hypothetical protein
VAAGPTYEPIATTTLSSAAASITFSSISSAYTDLRLIVTAIGTTAVGLDLNFNSDTATNYSQTALRGNGTAATSSLLSNRTKIDLTYTTNLQTTPTLRIVDIFSYAGSTYKTVLTSDNADLNGSGSVTNTVGLWRSTSAITTVALAVSGTMAAGTTATLYGIKAA